MTRRDGAWAVSVGTLTFGIYLSTMAPGVIDITDTPKFQFIGHVLGVAHNPGYPLYSILTYFFGHLPAGSLAYRINLFSALCGALSCVVAYLLARHLGSERVVAAAAIVAFALGPTVWSVSTVAEVYTLHVLLIAGILLALVRWRDTQRPSFFYLAIAIFAVAEGHHTDVVLMVPVIAIYACTVAPRFALRVRTVAIAATICLIGLLQYAFIIIRTRQGAFVESPANNVKDLFNIVRGEQFAQKLLPVSMPMLLHDRLPLIGRIFVTELTIVGVVLAVTGVVVLWRIQWRNAALLTMTLIAFAGFGVTYGVADVADFMIPAYLACWILAAITATWVVSWLRVHSGAVAAAAMTAGFAVLPAYAYAHNRAENDLSHRWAPVRFMDALFRTLPDRSVVLREDFLVDRMVYYKTLGEGATRGRSILAPYPGDYQRVADIWRHDYHVFAFSKTAALLRLEGADFEYTAYPVPDGTLDRFIADLPARSIVAIAVPGARFSPFAQANRDRMARIGVRVTPVLVENFAAIAVVGESRPLQDGGAVRTAAVHVQRGDAIGATGDRAPTEIAAEASQTAASIRFGPREILHTGEAAVAVWDPRGTLVQAFALEDKAARVPTRPEALKIFRMRALRTWTEVSANASDISGGTSSGNIVFRLAPPQSTAIVYCGRSRPLAPGIFDKTTRQEIPIEVTEYGRDGASRARLGRDLLVDGFADDARVLGSPFVYRVAVSTPRDIQAPVAFQLGLGGLPDVALARTSIGPAATYFPVDLSTHLEPIDGRTTRLHMARDHHRELVGAGWDPVDVDDYGPFRRMRDAEAELLIPAAGRAAIRLRVQAAPAGATNGIQIALTVNGRELMPQPFKAGWNRYDWTVPADIVRPVNSVVVKTSVAGASVSDVLIITP